MQSSLDARQVVRDEEEELEMVGPRAGQRRPHLAMRPAKLDGGQARTAVERGSGQDQRRLGHHEALARGRRVARPVRVRTMTTTTISSGNSNNRPKRKKMTPPEMKNRKPWNNGCDACQMTPAVC